MSNVKGAKDKYEKRRMREIWWEKNAKNFKNSWFSEISLIVLVIMPVLSSGLCKLFSTT